MKVTESDPLDPKRTHHSRTPRSVTSAMTKGDRPMEVDILDGSNCRAPPSKELVPIPVTAGSSGSGLPYAPENWPQPGDMWRWRVGTRRSPFGHWIDRLLYPPYRFRKVTGSRLGFQSRLSVEEYIKKEYRDADVKAFFSSFIWKIPCADNSPVKEMEKSFLFSLSPQRLDFNECSGSGSAIRGAVCKAGNQMCNLQMKARSSGLTSKACDICCSEAGFCRDCCCILCCGTIDWAYGGCSFIRCKATLDENFVCGHVAHIDCALRSCMAGTDRESIRLDVEYYCARCDNKTDLMPHVIMLLKTCESLDSQDDIGKILSLGLSILRGSEQTRARNLRGRIESVMAKLKDGVHLDGIWKEEDSISAFNAGNITDKGNSRNEVDPPQGNETAKDRTDVSVKLDDDINQVLEELKKSQESEYKLVEQKLHAQKGLILGLYQQLDAEKSELANPVSLPKGSRYDYLLTSIMNRVNQIKDEEAKLRVMMRIGKGFQRTSQSVLAVHFKLPEDE